MERREPSPWLLLIHSLPSEPGYLRVKISRRLQRAGAVALKSTVYALPNRPACREDLEWIAREVRDGGGEAWLCEANLLEGVCDEDLRQLFRQARRADYEELASEAQRLTEAQDPPPVRSLGRLRRRLAQVRALDFFEAPMAESAQSAVERLEERSRGAAGSPASMGELTGRTWVTRPGVEEDRIASAWLIQRFIDPQASFAFAEEASEPVEGELRFDMFGGEFTHEADRCTFETLLERFELGESALRELAEILHDIDCRDEKYSRPATASVDRFIRALTANEPDDLTRLRQGALFFDALYAALGGSAAP